MQHMVEGTKPLMLKLPLTTATAWVSKLGASSGKGHYSIGSLWCLLAHLNIKSMSEMMTKFQSFAVPQIGINERREIVQYFTG